MYINRTIIVERDSRDLTVRVLDALAGYDTVQQAAADAVQASETAATAAGAATSAAEAALAAAEDATERVEGIFRDLPDMLADMADHAIGAVMFTRRESYAFEVVADDPDLTTAGGVFLRALPDSEGFVSVVQYGAVPDGNRLTGAGTDNTAAFRRAFASPHNIKFGWGTFAVRGTVQNLKENRVVKGAGMGMCCSSPIQDRLYFNAPTCILAIGDEAVRRVITRRNYRASASDPNDPGISAVIENYGAGSTFLDFSVELFCDYTNMSPSNLGADWDVGFFNGCRSNVGLDHVSVLGYFRKASTYWDVTDAYGIPNVLDIYGNPVPFPTAGADVGPAYGRGSGADACWMNKCEIRGRLPRVILGPRAGITGNPYYDWVTETTYADGRGQSGVSDFRSRDCIMRAEHHSNYRMADPVGYGGTLTYEQMMAEGDFCPAVQYIDSGNTNAPDVAGPSAAGRGIILDDLRQVTREPFGTRLGQVKELYFGERFWAESNGTPAELRDTSGNDIFANRVNETTHFYGHLCTNEFTGRVVWRNTVTSIFTRWVYSWEWTEFTDRQGRRRAIDDNFATAPVSTNVSIPLSRLRPGGFIAIMTGGIGNSVPLSPASAWLLYDVGSTPNLSAIGSAGANVQILTPGTVPSDDNVTAGNLGVVAMADGRLILRNRLAAGETLVAWRVL